MSAPLWSCLKFSLGASSVLYKLTVKPKQGFSNSEASALSAVVKGISDVWRDYYIQVDAPLSAAQVRRLTEAVGNPVTERVEVGKALLPGSMVQITYRDGIVDNENDSLIRMCRLLGVEAVACKVATTYVGQAQHIVEALRRYVVNPTIEDLNLVEPSFDDVLPKAFRTPMRTFDLAHMDDQALSDLGRENGRNLNLAQMERIRRYQGGAGLAFVSDTLLEALDARWSDHCFHTTWKALGDLLSVLRVAAKQTNNPNIVSMFEDNAGVWRFYDGFALAFKAETHNEPSAISAYFGQLTKLGGVLRDVLGCGLGANPIGVFEYTATGLTSAADPLLEAARRLRPGQIARETIRAIREYGNTMGVAMMWCRMDFHPRYRAKPFALGGCIGLLPEKFAQKGTPEPGDHVVLVGGLTGNDGIHGASASSAGSAMAQSSVQIGSPLEEVKFREAILDLRDRGCIRAINDVGGAGLNSAVGEMGEACGVWINTAAVPLKVAGLSTWQILLSESQERMVLAVPSTHLRSAEEILDRHDVRHTVIGRFTNTDSFTVIHDEALGTEQISELDPTDAPMGGEVAMSVPYEVLNDCPLPELTVNALDRTRTSSGWPRISESEVPELLRRMLESAELADQTYARSQYDSSVQGVTTYGPYFGSRYFVPTSYWAARPMYGKPYAAIFSTSFNPWLFEVDPVLAARQMMVTVLQSQVLAGVSLQDICLCDNFFTPNLDEHGYFWLIEMVKELSRLSLRFGTPFISGKDSSAGSTIMPNGATVHVPPAVFLSALGKVPNAAKLLRHELSQPGNLLVQIGLDTPSPGGTLLSRILNLPFADLDELDVGLALDYLGALAALPFRVLKSGVPIGVGGLIATSALISLGSELGVELFTPDEGYHELFKERRCGALVEVAADALQLLPLALHPRPVGRVVDRANELRVAGVNVLNQKMVEGWQNSYKRMVTS